MHELKEGSKNLEHTLKDIDKVLKAHKHAIDEVIEGQAREAAQTVPSYP